MRKVSYYFYSFAFLMVLFSCRKESTIWNSSWSIPLINDTLNLSDFQNDSILSIENNQYILSLDKSLYKIKLSDYLLIPDTTISSELGIVFPSLTINPGVILSENNKENTISISNAQLKKCTIKTGKINITLKNPLTTNVFYTIEIPSISKNNQIINTKIAASAGTTVNPTEVKASFDLTGYEIDLTGIDKTSYNTLLTNFSLQIDPDGPSIKVTNKDKSSMDIEMSGIQLDYARGYFGNLTVQDTKNIDVKGFNIIKSGDLFLEKANIELAIKNSCKISARGRISTLSNTNTSSNKTIELASNQLANPFFITSAIGDYQTLQSTIKRITFNETNSTILPFLENLGSKYNVSYLFEINPYGNLSGGWDEFFDNSEIDLRLKTNIPLRLQAENLILKDTFSLDLSNIEQSVTKGSFVLNYTNSFPISADCQLHFINENNQVVDVIDSNVPLKPTLEKNQLNFTLTQKLLASLKSIRKIIVTSTFNTTDDGFVTIPIDSKLLFQLHSQFNLENTY
jgi:hypothetical protein